MIDIESVAHTSASHQHAQSTGLPAVHCVIYKKTRSKPPAAVLASYGGYSSMGGNSLCRVSAVAYV